MSIIKQRDSFFDNFKAILIFLVVLGHILESFLNNSSFLVVYNIIYAFHMPAFVFVAGYFAKNIEKQEESVLFDFLIPYFVFNSLYQVLLWKSFKINLFEPIYVYWFLLSMFFWKIFLKKIIQLRFAIFLLIAISLYCGIFDDISRCLSVSRTLVFFPYFVVGYFCTEETISKIKSMPKFLGILLFFLASSTAVGFFSLNSKVPIEILKGADSFNTLSLSILSGTLARIVLILIAAAFIVALINLISKKQFKFTYIGKNTLVIYLFHPFLLYIFNKFYLVLPHLNEYLELAVCFILAVFITGILSFPLLTQWYFRIFARLQMELKKDVQL